jgi:homoserine dehydrogenase
MSEPLRIALAGLGTVGGGVIRLIETNADLIARRAGRRIEIVAVAARDRSKDRGVDLSRYAWEDDMTAMAAREDVDVVVELVGGSDGPALTLARNTLAAGKDLVTANKAMIANHGLELADLAEKADAALKFEAAVAGGIPVIKGLKEGVAANEINRVYGILNGTCNYILSTMEDTGRDFGDVLAEAQAKGYAEADPTFDIDGIDAAHKLAILSSVAFGTKIDFKGVAATGIRRIVAADIAQADVLGYYIRLIGMADTEVDADGNRRLFQRVQPHLVHRDHPLAHVDGATNAVVAEGNFVGRLLFQGPGAGDGPTASAVVADLIDIARGDIGAPFSIPVAELAEAPGSNRPPHRQRLLALHRRGSPRRARRDHRRHARCGRLDREPDPEGHARRRSGRRGQCPRPHGHPRWPGKRDHPGAGPARRVALPGPAAGGPADPRRIRLRAHAQTERPRMDDHAGPFFCLLHLFRRCASRLRGADLALGDAVRVRTGRWRGHRGDVEIVHRRRGAAKAVALAVAGAQARNIGRMDLPVVGRDRRALLVVEGQALGLARLLAPAHDDRPVGAPSRAAARRLNPGDQALGHIGTIRSIKRGQAGTSHLGRRRIGRRACVSLPGHDRRPE